MPVRELSKTERRVRAPLRVGEDLLDLVPQSITAHRPEDPVAQRIAQPRRGRASEVESQARGQPCGAQRSGRIIVKRPLVQDPKLTCGEVRRSAFGIDQLERFASGASVRPLQPDRHCVHREISPTKVIREAPRLDLR